MSDAEKLAAAETLDRAYAESDAFHLAQQASEPDGEYADEMAELHKAALNRGQP